MYFNKLKYFIYDFIILVSSVTLIIIGLYFGNIMDIQIKVHLLSISCIIIIIFYTIQLYNEIVAKGIRAIFDLLFKNYVVLEAICVDQIPARASSINETYSKYSKGSKINRARKTYFKIIILHDRKTMVLTSPEYLHIERDKKYSFLVAATSHIIVDIK